MEAQETVLHISQPESDKFSRYKCNRGTSQHTSCMQLQQVLQTCFCFVKRESEQCHQYLWHHSHNFSSFVFRSIHQEENTSFAVADTPWQLLAMSQKGFGDLVFVMICELCSMTTKTSIRRQTASKIFLNCRQNVSVFSSWSDVLRGALPTLHFGSSGRGFIQSTRASLGRLLRDRRHQPGRHLPHSRVQWTGPVREHGAQPETVPIRRGHGPRHTVRQQVASRLAQHHSGFYHPRQLHQRSGTMLKCSRRTHFSHKTEMYHTLVIKSVLFSFECFQNIWWSGHQVWRKEILRHVSPKREFLWCLDKVSFLQVRDSYDRSNAKSVYQRPT